MQYIVICFVVFSKFYCSATVDVSIKAWIEKGYYFSHQCQVTIEVTSNYFQNKNQLFHIQSANKNSYFLSSQDESLNTIYAIANNFNEEQFIPKTSNCLFKDSQTYHCVYIPIAPHQPHYYNFLTKINQTYNKMIFRITRVLCPAENEKLEFNIKMPISSDYDKYYNGYYYRGSQLSFTKEEQLSYIYSSIFSVNTRNLTYKPLHTIQFPQQVNFLKQCNSVYTINFQFQNISYYESWDAIDIYVSDRSSILLLSDSCYSNFMRQYKCEKKSYGYRLTHINKIKIVKSYQFTKNEVYLYPPIRFSIGFALSFQNPGKVQFEVVCISQSQMIQQNWFNFTHKVQQIYGRKTISLYAFEQTDFSLIKQLNTKKNPLQCVHQWADILIFEGASNSSSITLIQNSLSLSKIIIIFFFILVCFTTFKAIWFRQSATFIEKLVYLITIIALFVLKITYLILGLNSGFLRAQQTHQSLILNQQQYFQLFIMKCTFIIQIGLNIFYFWIYLILFIVSDEILTKIKKMYGKKYKLYNQDKRDFVVSFGWNKSTIIFFTSIVISLLMSYKFFGIFLYKLHKNQEQQKNRQKQQTLKFHFKNIYLYKIHQTHLIIDIAMEINVLIWLSLLLYRKQISIEIFIFLFVLLIVSGIQIYLLSLVQKEILCMYRSSQSINQVQNSKLKLDLFNIQAEQCQQKLNFNQQNQQRIS